MMDTLFNWKKTIKPAKLLVRVNGQHHIASLDKKNMFSPVQTNELSNLHIFIFPIAFTVQDACDARREDFVRRNFFPTIPQLFQSFSSWYGCLYYAP